jgi:hypothetical protein
VVELRSGERSDGAAVVGSAAMAKSRRARVPYAHRTRIEKLGVKRAQHVLLVGLDDASFRAELRHAGAHVTTRASDETDLIFLRADDRDALVKLAGLEEKMKRDGAIWVIRPRGSDAITEADVMSAGKAAGLVDVKVARFSDAHSALKFVIPVSKR